MKKLLLIILLLSQPIYAHNLEATSTEQNRPELHPTVCEVTEGDRISYLAYISGAVNSPNHL